ncbi:hypothetical protein TRVL_09424 [Trypanosoma vivax]|nr:hypothetical protein TRVL_09424 [Trypanosoma vivax]
MERIEKHCNAHEECDLFDKEPHGCSCWHSASIGDAILFKRRNEDDAVVFLAVASSYGVWPLTGSLKSPLPGCVNMRAGHSGIFWTRNVLSKRDGRCSVPAMKNVQTVGSLR